MPRRFRTGDQTLVRELNRSILLQRLRVGPPLSRADLAAATGLNKTTVSNLVDELIADGFVREIGRDASGGGRPGVLLELNPDGGWIIGAEFGVGHMIGDRGQPAGLHCLASRGGVRSRTPGKKPCCSSLDGLAPSGQAVCPAQRAAGCWAPG